MLLGVCSIPGRSINFINHCKATSASFGGGAVKYGNLVVTGCSRNGRLIRGRCEILAARTVSCVNADCSSTGVLSYVVHAEVAKDVA